MSEGRAKKYRCVVGHEILPDELETRTEVQVLDGGAEVQVCREHGAPIAVTLEPDSIADEGQ